MYRLQSRPLWQRNGNGPSRVLDFIDRPAIPAGWTFSRASMATWFDASCVMQTAGNDAPRFDHDPATGTALGLCMESSRINSLTWSDQAEKWIEYGLSAKADTTLAVDQRTAARRLTEDTSNGAHAISETFAVSIGSATTYSYFSRLRAGSRTSVHVMLTDGPTTDYCYAMFDLTTGRVTGTFAGSGAWKLASASCLPLAAGWFECRISGIVTSASLIRGTTYMVTGGAHSYTGDGMSWLLHGGSQLESGTPTSYIPTTNMAATRAADYLATSDLSFLDPQNGTLVFDGSIQGVSGGGVFAFSLDDGTNNGIGLYKTNGNGNLTAYSGSATGTNLGLAVSDGQRFSGGIAWSGAGASASASVNGLKPAAVTGAEAVKAKELCLGGARTRQFASNVLVRSLTYWPRRLTDAELEAATALSALGTSAARLLNKGV